MAAALENFLKQYSVKKNSAEVGPLEHTHSQIPCHDSNYKVYGGSYNIPHDKMNEFYDIYKNHVFKLGKYAHLTEKQFDESAILIDVDFRYTIEIEERQHTKEHISDLVNCILEGISKIKLTNNKSIEVYIFEKEDVNI
jgi:hypothetical protein